MYKCVIFDVDGTLIDTEVAILSGLQKAVNEEMDVKYSTEELSFVLGITTEAALEKLEVKNAEGFTQKWNDYIKDYYCHIKLFDGIKETLGKLKEAGILMGVVTSRIKSEMNDDFVKFGLEKYFDIVICAEDTKKHKPNPEPILKFIEKATVEPSSILYVGDTIYDMKCAGGAGVDFGLALWGAKSDKGMKPKYIFRYPNEIYNAAIKEV